MSRNHSPHSPHRVGRMHMARPGRKRVGGDEAFALSRHAEARARERGFRDGDVDLVVDFGTPVHHGYVLTREDVAAFAAWSRAMLERLEKLSCTFVPVAQDTVASIYRPGKRKRRRLLDEAGRCAAALHPHPCSERG